MKPPSTLIYVSDEDPGITRKKWGKGFVYLDPENNKIICPDEILRIKSLVIPPIWQKVWICKLSNGHLQSTGRDLKNRKQYLYHQDWISYRQNAKFSNLLEFGYQLKTIRKEYLQGLKKRKWNKNKVIALIIYLLDNYYFRIGSPYYTKTNNSYGITTLRRKHIKDESTTLRINYKAKSGKMRNINIENKRIAKLIRQISELPGYEIFTYLDESGKRSNVESNDINMYLQELTKCSISAKNFRTWGASKLAIAFYEDTINDLKENPRLKFETTLIKKVAAAMGNTVSVCREYYIHPLILSTLNNHFPNPIRQLVSRRITSRGYLDIEEKILIELLEKNQ